MKGWMITVLIMLILMGSFTMGIMTVLIMQQRPAPVIHYDAPRATCTSWGTT